jgi:hypothetical protein
LCVRFVSAGEPAEGEERPLWPMVATVRVKHNWAVLAGGATLVDLPSAAAPGSSVRAWRVAAHLHRCHMVCAAAGE